MKPLFDQFPANRLPREEETRLAGLIRAGDEDALNTLVLANMREALLYTRRVCHDQIDEQTRVSLCYQEMIMSARRFKPGKTRYFAFAKAGLRGRMKDYWSSLTTVRNAREMVSCEGLETYTMPGCGGCRKWGTVFRRVVPGTFGKLREPEDDHEVSVREGYTNEIEMPNLEPMIAKDHWNQIRKRMASLLTDQQWMILDLTYKGDLTFPQIGKLLGLTRSAIHASHRNSIKKLRAAICADGRLLL